MRPVTTANELTKSHRPRSLWCDNDSVKDDNKPHPGPWRVAQVDSEFAGLLIAVGLVVLALVSMPAVATAFLLGALLLGVLVALLLGFSRAS